MPLPFGQSSIAPFNADDFSMSMAQQGKYSCGFNLFHMSLTFSPNPGVPVNRQGAWPYG